MLLCNVELRFVGELKKVAKWLCNWRVITVNDGRFGGVIEAGFGWLALAVTCSECSRSFYWLSV